MPRAIEVQVPLSMYWRHRYAELTCQPILCRHYASMTQDGLQIAGTLWGGDWRSERGTPMRPPPRMASTSAELSGPSGCPRIYETPVS